MESAESALLLKLFSLIDHDNDQQISVQDLKLFVSSLINQEINDEEILKRTMQMIGIDQRGFISSKAFLDFVEQGSQNAKANDDTAFIKLFEYLDVDSDGVISQDDLERSLQFLYEEDIGKIAKRLLKQADFNRDGYIDIGEFKRLYRYV
ncbi:hypothetical protein ACOME3_004511 [Neoechinorhynchus agilis]